MSSKFVWEGGGVYEEEVLDLLDKLKGNSGQNSK